MGTSRGRNAIAAWLAFDGVRYCQIDRILAGAQQSELKCEQRTRSSTIPKFPSIVRSNVVLSGKLVELAVVRVLTRIKKSLS